jgi:multiple sugar transport system substrate-binding protein
MDVKLQPAARHGSGKWHRLAAVGAIATVTALAVTACAASAESEQPAEAKELSVWFPGSNPVEIELVTKTIVPAFEEETGVKVDVTYLDYKDMSTKLNAAFAGGTAPDVFGHGPAAVADFVVNERVEPLTDYVAALPEEEREDMAAALPGGQVDGVQYLMPMSLQAVLLVYNKDDFADAGLDQDDPPTTWEGIREAAEALTVRDSAGTVTHSGLLLPSQPVGRQQSFSALLTSAGGSLLSDDNSKAEFDSPEGLQALEFFIDTYSGDAPVSANLGANYIDSPSAQQPLATGDASITALSAQAASQLQTNFPELNLGVIQPPKFEDADKGYAVGGAGAGLMINADSPNKDLGWKFIQYMTSKETSTEYTEGIGGVPMRASAMESDYVKNSPIVQSWLEASDNLKPNPNVPGWVQVRDTIDKYLEQALNRTIEPEDALEQMAHAVDAILAQNQ